MESRFYLINLYDIYGDLLTEKQKEYFEDYYFNNLTLSEMSENYEVSRNAIHKQLKEVEEKLNKYEETLKIDQKNKRIKEICNDLNDDMKEKILDIL